MSSIAVNTPIQLREVQSKRFLCGKCLNFCIETIPVIKAGMGRAYFAEQQRRGANPFKKIPMKCPNGHHQVLGWTFYDINDPKARKRIR